MATSTEGISQNKQVIKLEGATVRFAGDSGDGMQLAGTQLTNTSALAGNDVATFPDFPAEIRAPRGTLAGVSGFQIHFASSEIFTPGDSLDALVAMNPAALKTNLSDLRTGGILIVDKDSFDKKGLEQAGYAKNPLEDGSLDSYQLYQVELTKNTRNAVESLGLGMKAADRCRNFYAMGLVFWLYGRSLEPTRRYVQSKFKGEVAEANLRSLEAGRNYGETTDAFYSSFQVDRAELKAGKYRNIIGNQALAWGVVAAAKLSKCELFLGSYPITPASDILHYLSEFKHHGVKTFQAEDEIAAMTATIGAAFGGDMAITTSSGPGIALKGEAIGLGVMLELPMLIINVQRGGPSTGLPTKTEQSDLFQAVFGRNGECPVPVIAARSPSDCFNTAIEAWQIAVRYMTPVMLLSDGYIANGAEPWEIPVMSALPNIPVEHPGPRSEDDPPFMPYQRDQRLARPWALPGTVGLTHRIGGLEKQDVTGNISYDPANHQHMVNTRAQKVNNVANDYPATQIEGADQGELLVISWGGTYGSCLTAVRRMQALGHAVSHVHLRYINPLPNDLHSIMQRFKHILVPELNMGQLLTVIRSKYVIDAKGFNKVQGRPFGVGELMDKIGEYFS